MHDAVPVMLTRTTSSNWKDQWRAAPLWLITCYYDTVVLHNYGFVHPSPSSALIYH